MARLTTTKVSVELLLGNIEGNWTADENEQNAAWELYVELIMTIPISGVNPKCIKSLKSFQNISDFVKELLRKYGPLVAKPKGYDDLSFGHLAIALINMEIRPVLEKWHSCLMEYEHEIKENSDLTIDEDRWENDELKNVINKVYTTLTEYAQVMARITGVPSLITSGS